MLANVRKAGMLALAQGDYCGRKKFRKVPKLTTIKALKDEGLIGNKARLTARGWAFVRRIK
jgi:hypothetical protein